MAILRWLKGAAGSRVSTDVSLDDPVPVQAVAPGGGPAVVSQAGALVDVNTAVAADVALTIAAAADRRLLGFVVEESAAVAAAAEVRIRHGGVAGDLLEIIKLAADGSDRRWWGPNGIAVPNGVSIDWVAGQVDINLFYV